MKQKVRRGGGDLKWATFELLCVRGSGFLLVLGAALGNRSQGRTWDCGTVSLPLRLRLPLSLPLSSSRYLRSPVITLPPSPSSHYFLSSFVFLSSCPSSPLFLPHLLHLSVVSFSSPPSPPHLHSLTCTVLSHALAVQPVLPLPSHPGSKAMMEHVYISFYNVLASLLPEVPNYLNAKLNLVPALWLLLTLIIHFYEKRLCSNHC